MGFSINRLLIPAFFAYIAYVIWELYVFCQPPLAIEGGEGEPSVSWDLLQSKPLDLCVYFSLLDQPPQESFVRDRNTPAGKVHGSERKTYYLIGTFESVVPATGEAPREELKLEELSLPEAFYRNDTVYIHVVAVPHEPADSRPVRHEMTRLSRHQVQPDRKVRKEYLLGAPDGISATDVEIVEAAIGAAPVSSIPRIVEIGFVNEPRPLSINGMKEKGLTHFVRQKKAMLPLFVNSMVSPRDEYAPLLHGTKLPSLELRLRSVGLGYFALQEQMRMAFDEAEKNMGLNEYDADSFKQMISGSTPLKIVLVYSVAILHLCFEYLAFSSDISFWRKKTSFEGLSSTSVTLQACMNIIMFLYVQEQQQTKFAMYMLGFRFLMQLWKLSKLTTLRRKPGFPFVRWVNRGGADAGLEELQGIDDAERRCMWGLLAILLPVVSAFSVYRLIYYKFRSWYSWVVLSLAVCSQMGGFVVMTPQVFMNWRLKSVEHLPWEALTYQAINTFIDDIFMLCIRMPEIQKYSVFRDDIIFIICCVQRWLYRKPEAIAPAAGDAKVTSSPACPDTPAAPASSSAAKPSAPKSSATPTKGAAPKDDKPKAE